MMHSLVSEGKSGYLTLVPFMNTSHSLRIIKRGEFEALNEMLKYKVYNKICSIRGNGLNCIRMLYVFLKRLYKHYMWSYKGFISMIKMINNGTVVNHIWETGLTLIK